jgi:hypothetical protein
MRSSIALLLAAVCLASCGGAVTVDGDHISEAGAGGTSGSDPIPSDISFSFDNPEVSCEEQGTALPACTEAQGIDHLVGRWYQCSGSWFGMVAPMPPANGVQFSKDGTWRALSIVDDQVRFASGSNTMGTWKSFDAMLSTDACSLGLNIYVDGSGMSPAYAEYESSPRRMRLNTGGDGARPRFAAIP